MKTAITCLMLIGIAFTASATKTTSTHSITEKTTGENRKVDSSSNSIDKDVEPASIKKAPKPLKVFDVYPTQANKFVYIRITGKQVVSMTNGSGKQIFKTAIREKATVDLSKLPPDTYQLKDEKTGAVKQFRIVRNM